jgi:hypothetical protein
MDARLVIVLLGSAVISIIIAIRFVSNATPWGMFCFAWVILAAVGVGTAYHFGLASDLVWSLTHAARPLSQRQFTQRLATRPGADAACSSHEVVEGWVGQLRGAFEMANGQALYIHIDAGPRLVIANAGGINRAGFGPAKGTPLFDRVQSLSSGQAIKFSGVLEGNPGNCPKADGSVEVLMDPADIQIDNRWAPTVPAVLVVFWLVCTIPGWGVLGYGYLLASRKERDTQNGRIFRARVQPIALSSAPPIPSISTMAADYEQSLTDGREEDSKTILGTLETANPGTEADWLILKDIFKTTKRTAADQLVCERFLIVEPGNINAQVHLLNLLFRDVRNYARVRAMIDSISKKPDLTADQIVGMIPIMKKLSLLSEAVELCRRFNENGFDVTVQRNLVSLLILLDLKAESNTELLILSQKAPRNFAWNVICVEFGARLHNDFIVTDRGNSAISTMDPNNHALLSRFFEALRSCRANELLEKSLACINYGSVKTAESMSALFFLVEACGIPKQTLVACRRLLELNPHHSKALTSLPQLEKWH